MSDLSSIPRKSPGDENKATEFNRLVAAVRQALRISGRDVMRTSSGTHFRDPPQPSVELDPYLVASSQLLGTRDNQWLYVLGQARFSYSLFDYEPLPGGEEVIAINTAERGNTADFAGGYDFTQEPLASSEFLLQPIHDQAAGAINQGAIVWPRKIRNADGSPGSGDPTHWFHRTNIIDGTCEQGAAAAQGGVQALEPFKIGGFFDYFDEAGGQTIDGTGTVQLDTAREALDESRYTINDGEIIVARAGFYIVLARVSVDGASGSAVDAKIYLEKREAAGGAWTEIDGTQAHFPTRGHATFNVGGASTWAFIKLAEGDELRLRLERVDGSAALTTIANGSGVTIIGPLPVHAP